MTTTDTTTALNPRVAEVFSELVEALADLIRKHRITFDEYRQIVGFMDEIGKSGEVPLFLDVLVSVTVDDINYAADGGTESNVEGPFYIPEAPLLTRPYELPRREDEPGEGLFLSGSVRSTDGTPLAGAMLDMWQADAEGKYSHFYPGLPEYNLRGRFTTDAEGRFEVRTTVPASYEIPKAGPTGRFLAALGRHAFRPAHLHFRLSHAGHEPLTTQLYFEGDPWLDSDVVGAVKQSLVVRLEQREASGDQAKVDGARTYRACSYDFVLQPRMKA